MLLRADFNLADFKWTLSFIPKHVNSAAKGIFTFLVWTICKSFKLPYNLRCLICLWWYQIGFYVLNSSFREGEIIWLNIETQAFYMYRAERSQATVKLGYHNILHKVMAMPKVIHYVFVCGFIRITSAFFEFIIFLPFLFRFIVYRL